MNVTVRYFAAAADAAGCEEEQLEVTAVAPAASPTLAELKAVLQDRYGAEMTRVLASGSFLVDEIVRRDPEFPLSRRVDVLPPFAGG